MAIKQAFVIMALIVAITGISMAEIPDLTGNWTGFYKGYEEGMGYVEGNWTFTMVISEQKDRLFTGTFIDIHNATQEGQESMEGFSGAIGLDNKTLYIAEYDSGYDIGTVLSNDTIELLYLDDREKAGAYIDTCYRVK